VVRLLSEDQMLVAFELSVLMPTVFLIADGQVCIKHRAVMTT
jgi:hypothetical protein